MAHRGAVRRAGLLRRLASRGLRDPQLSTRPRSWVFGVALLASWLLVAEHAAWVDRSFVAAARAKTAEWSSPQAAPGAGDAPVDYFVDFDGYYFVSYAREMLADGIARVRWTRLDDTPDGRPVHWSALFPWWLVALGSLHALTTGEPLDAAVAAAAYYANPLLFALLLGALGLAALRRLGPGAAAVLVLTLASQPVLLENFGFARPDHHGLQLGFALGSLLCLVLGGAGWTRTAEASAAAAGAPPLPSARRWFAASGVLGGLGLWVGATQTSVVLASIGAGAALAMTLGRAAGGERAQGVPDPAPAYHPELWRTWGVSGAATSLVAFAVEYLPGHAGMRLEVNHPLYALAWWCGGEILVRLGRLGRFGRLGRWRAAGRPLDARGAATLAAFGAGALALPLAVALGPVAWYWPKDPAMLHLHARIEEFLPLLGGARAFAALGTPALAAVALTAALAGRWLGPQDRTAAWLVAVPCLCLAGWTLAQARWAGLLAVAGTCALVVLWVAAGRAERSRLARRGLAGLVAAGLALHLGLALARLGPAAGERGAAALRLDVFMRDFAVNLCPPAAYRGPVRVMAGPAESARLHFFGRCRGVGTPYWENLDGVRDTAAFFAATDDAAALGILRARQIDYVLVANSEAFLGYMQLTATGQSDPAAVEATLGQRLVAGAPPPWLQPVGIRDWPAARRWRIYRFAPPAPTADAHSGS